MAHTVAEGSTGMEEKARPYSVAILTVSDRGSSGVYEDKSGPLLAELVQTQLGGECRAGSSVEVMRADVVPDEESRIRERLLYYCDEAGVDLVLTTGGTGFSPRDVTPEVTRSILHREAPGFVVALIEGSLKITPLAMLSRPAAGTRNGTLILNFPGSPKAVRENFSLVYRAIPHALALLSGKNKVEATRHSLPGAKGVAESKEADAHQCGCGHTKQRPPTLQPGFRERCSRWPMVPVMGEALPMVLDKAREALVLKSVSLPLSDACGFVLAETVSSRSPYPPFRASVKDGYAVHSADGEGEYEVVSVSTAGKGSLTALPRGKVCRIATGAPLPEGADAVVMVECTERVSCGASDGDSSADSGEEKLVRIGVSVSPGQDIRPVGVDIEAGKEILAAGTVLGPSEIGLLAMLNHPRVDVVPHPRVTVLSTGDELLDIGEASASRKRPHSIIDSNRLMLRAQLASVQGAATIQDGGIVRDDYGALRERMKQLLSTSDVIITTGGVSMGEKDYVQDVLEELGTVHFGRLHMKPGKPTTFGTVQSGSRTVLVFALPGNPVSAMVSSILLVVPALKLLAGRGDYQHRVVQVALAHAFRTDPERPEYHRAITRWDAERREYVAQSTGHQASSRLLSLRSANALLCLPAQKEALRAGEKVDAILLD
eukprot:CAMPEP_0119124278 /NCGR_PEP_ID=MMETSP1310-20130426/3949_1 /TAXON_ID=464262 /ORGANISM="Genus nov. species nov., Strain RCC2339" /LENGTH=658 /DNA_ID=CAMNT_0007114203 /DNA_START=40 /DNA_END=2016 /DNA_ORIENTATION=-